MGVSRSSWRAAVAGIAALIAAGAAPISLAAASLTQSERQFVATYVAALKSNDRNQLRSVYHPATLACLDSATQPYFDWVFDHDLVNGAALTDGYQVESFKAVDAQSATAAAPPDLFSYPVIPTHQMQINARSRDGRYLILMVALAPTGGAWGVVLPCPNARGVQMIQKQLASRRP